MNQNGCFVFSSQLFIPFFSWRCVSLQACQRDCRDDTRNPRCLVDCQAPAPELAACTVTKTLSTKHRRRFSKLEKILRSSRGLQESRSRGSDVAEVLRVRGLRRRRRRLGHRRLRRARCLMFFLTNVWQNVTKFWQLYISEICQLMQKKKIHANLPIHAKCI